MKVGIDWTGLYSATSTILLNLIASLIFIYLLLKIGRPKFLISPHICAREKDGKTKYYFKIVNASIFHAFDTDIELRLMKPILHIGNHSNVE